MRFAFDGGAADLRFCDPRRFGTGELAVGVAARDAFLGARLGLEPLSGALDGATLHRLSRGRRAPVKAFLLDQRHVAGVGNIYADEALFRARIHPLRPAGSLTRAQCEELAGAVRAALEAGIDAGGATIDDFRHADGVRGSFQDEFLVHRRRGEPCPACGGEVVKFVAAGRGTYACERACQPTSAAASRQVPPRRRRAGAARPRARPARAGAGAVGLEELHEAADDLAADDDLGEAHHAGELDEPRAALGVLREVDLGVLEPALLQQALGPRAERAGIRRVDRDVRGRHRCIKPSAGSGRSATPGRGDPQGGVSGPLKSEAVVLRSIRYGEADRILHLYTPHRGRVSAIAKGVRRTRSRFGGRLEPFFRLASSCTRVARTS